MPGKRTEPPAIFRLGAVLVRVNARQLAADLRQVAGGRTGASRRH
jgi:hypothetical protein